jgi:hypothetical protein
MRILMLVFALVLVSGPIAASGGDGATAHKHEGHGELEAECIQAGHSPSQHVSSCGGVGVAILPDSLAFDVPLEPQNSPLFAEGLYLSLTVDRLERPPAASAA